MNDITPKEAIANLNHLYGMVAPDIQRSLDVAIKALERPQAVCGNDPRWCERCVSKGKCASTRTQGEWDETSSEQEESEQPNDKTFKNVCDFNDGIADPTYINGIVDCSDLGIYPWGNS